MSRILAPDDVRRALPHPCPNPAARLERRAEALEAGLVLRPAGQYGGFAIAAPKARIPAVRKSSRQPRCMWPGAHRPQAEPGR